MSIKFEKSINLGTIIHLVTLVVAIFATYLGISTRLTSLEVKVDAMWKLFVKDVGAVERVIK